MSKVIEKKKFVCVDVKTNHNKYWIVELFDNDDVTTTWGRVGYGSSSQSKTHSGVGKYFMESKINEKLNKGYKEVETLDCASDNTKVSSSNTDLKKIATEQIKYSSDVVKTLIDFLVKTNAHNIYEASGGKITYNDTSGVFQTPLGVITKDSIDKARDLLNTIGSYVQKGNFTSIKAADTVAEYMTLVPMNIGMKFDISAIFPDQNSLVKQNSILDSLEASFNSVVSGSVKKDTTAKKTDVTLPKLFDVTLDYVDDKSIVSKIDKFFRDTKLNMHASSHLKIKTVYAVRIGHMAENFEKTGKSYGNVWELWHGTNVGNILSILKKGFIIPPSSASYCTGRMFGNGVYFSDQSTKSLNYAYGYWSGQRNNQCFMFLNDVAMGNYHVPPHSTSSKPPAGYHSYFAKAGKSSVQNNEMIVFDTCQINPKYLIEFSDK